MPAYVRQSAKLTCTMGSAQSAMQVSHPTSPVLLCGSPMAGMTDNMTFVNIAPFGLCKSLMNPTVIAATAAAGGKLQEMPCVPNMLIPWLNTKPDVFVKGRPALTDGSKCVCMWAGIIEVKSAGQESVASGATPTPLAIVEQQTQAVVETAVATAKAATQPPKKGLMATIAAAVKNAVESAVNTVKERLSAIIAAMSAAVMSVVSGIFALLGKGDEDGETDIASDDDNAEDEDTTDEVVQNGATLEKTEIMAKLTRFHFGRRTTIGTFEVFHNDSLKISCYTCEDVVRGKAFGNDADTVKTWKIPAETAIPYGRYKCTFSPDKDPGRRWLVTEVPGYDGIRIHSGNFANDTDGCLLLNRCFDATSATVSESQVMMTKFEDFMAKHGNKPFVLEITNDKKPGVTNNEFMAELNAASNANATTVEKCFCNRDFKPNDLKRIINGLRGLEKNVSGSLFCRKNCNIPREEKTIERLTTEINATCRTYDINKCIQKIHFLSQIYHESDRFRTAFGSATGKKCGPSNDLTNATDAANGAVDNAPKYEGRGLIQISEPDVLNTYLKTVKYTNEVLENIKKVITNRNDDKVKLRTLYQVNEKIILDDKNYVGTDAKTDAIIDKSTNNYASIISDSLATCADSAGWYWSRWKTISPDIKDVGGKTLNDVALFADKYQEIITKTINDGDDAKIKRKLYYNALKNIMNVYQCPNISMANCAIAPQNAGGTDKAKQKAKTKKDNKSRTQTKFDSGQTTQKTGGADEAKQNAPTAKPTTNMEADKSATTASTANSKPTSSNRKVLVVGVTGPQNASVGQRVEYQALFNVDNVGDADRKKVVWGMNYPGDASVKKLDLRGDRIILEIKQAWHREDIVISACMSGFQAGVSQQTSIDPDMETTDASRAKVCVSCDKTKDCRFKKSKYGYIIGDAELNEAAKTLGIEAELMKAIEAKESKGFGFRKVGQARILFERKLMRDNLIATGKYSSAQINDLVQKYPDIVNTVAGAYNVSPYDKIKIAKTIDVDCAIKSSSWGRFQIMGENYRWNAYPSTLELELAMNTCDLQQLKYFTAFLNKKPGMLDALRAKNWEKIAYLYNGSGWKTQNPSYPQDIEKYYNKFKNS